MEAATKQKEILVVDDQASMREMLADLLDMMGHEAIAVEGGPQALQLLAESTVDPPVLRA